jgi:hypothetical protein
MRTLVRDGNIAETLARGMILVKSMFESRDLGVVVGAINNGPDIKATTTPRSREKRED